MARSLINGTEQILGNSIPWSAMATGAIVPLASIVGSANILLADGTVAMTGALNMNSHLINNVTTPSGANDAANKAYVDAKVAGFQIHNVFFA